MQLVQTTPNPRSVTRSRETGLLPAGMLNSGYPELFPPLSFFFFLSSQLTRKKKKK
jgi:hypothetical protein